MPAERAISRRLKAAKPRSAASARVPSRSAARVRSLRSLRVAACSVITVSIRPYTMLSGRSCNSSHSFRRLTPLPGGRSHLMSVQACTEIDPPGAGREARTLTTGTENPMVDLIDLVQTLTTPHPLDRYLELVHPSLTVRRPRAVITEVDRSVPGSVTLTL